jgi:hypothetical protein
VNVRLACQARMPNERFLRREAWLPRPQPVITMLESRANLPDLS